MNWIASFRHITWIGVGSALAGSLFMFVIGGLKTVKAIWGYGQGAIPDTAVLSHLSPSDYAFVLLIKAVDAFLFGMVLLIFANALHRIFILEVPDDPDEAESRWYEVSSLGELKKIVLEVILVLLGAFFVQTVLTHIDDLAWNVLILPIGMFLISGSLALLARARTERMQGNRATRDPDDTSPKRSK